jgi:hypothetical protein
MFHVHNKQQSQPSDTHTDYQTMGCTFNQTNKLYLGGGVVGLETIMNHEKIPSTTAWGFWLPSSCRFQVVQTLRRVRPLGWKRFMPWGFLKVTRPRSAGCNCHQKWWLSPWLFDHGKLGFNWEKGGSSGYMMGGLTIRLTIWLSVWSNNSGHWGLSKYPSILAHRGGLVESYSWYVKKGSNWT